MTQQVKDGIQSSGVSIILDGEYQEIVGLVELVKLKLSLDAASSEKEYYLLTWLNKLVCHTKFYSKCL